MNKKLFVEILSITLIMMIVVGCSLTNTPDTPNLNETKKPSAQGMAHQQATVHVPAWAHAALPFSPVWTNKIEIRDYWKEDNTFEVIKIGNKIIAEPGLYTGVYVTNKSEIEQIFECFKGDTCIMGPYSIDPNYGSMVKLDYNQSLTGCTLVSVEPKEGFENYWIIKFLE